MAFLSWTAHPLKIIRKWLFSSTEYANVVLLWTHKENKTSSYKTMEWTFFNSYDDWSYFVKAISSNLRVTFFFRCQKECEYWVWPHFQKGEREQKSWLWALNKAWSTYGQILHKNAFFPLIKIYSKNRWAWGFLTFKMVSGV